MNLFSEVDIEKLSEEFKSFIFESLALNIHLLEVQFKKKVRM